MLLPSLSSFNFKARVALVIGLEYELELEGSKSIGAREFFWHEDTLKLMLSKIELKEDNVDLLLVY